MNTSYRSPILAFTKDSTLGNSHAPSNRDMYGEHSTAVHYGNPLGEQSYSETHPVIVDRSDRRTFLISGEDALSWLNTLITQKVDRLSRGEHTRSLILNVQGHILHHFDLLSTAEGVILDIPSGDADDLVTYLQSMIFWAQVHISECDWAALSILLPLSTQLSSQRSATQETVHPLLAHPDALRSYEWGGRERIDFWVPRSELLSSWKVLLSSCTPCGSWAWNALRIHQRDPLLALDLDSNTIPHEVPYYIGDVAGRATQRSSEKEGHSASSVHLNKGCYRGQETVSRVQNLGQPPRLLVKLNLDGSVPEYPPVGTDITAAGRKVGRLGTIVQDAEEGPIALGLIRRGVVESIASAREKGSDLPTLVAENMAVSIEPDDLHINTAIPQGRQSVQRLRGQTPR